MSEMKMSFKCGTLKAGFHWSISISYLHTRSKVLLGRTFCLDIVRAKDSNFPPL